MYRIYYDAREIPTFLYHGTTSSCVESIKEGINIKEGRNDVDFGQGFYLTANLKQAEQWAQMKRDYFRKRNRRKETSGAIIKFKLDCDILSEKNCLFFDCVDRKWAEFVFNNRADREVGCNHKEDGSVYDFVYGPLADGRDFSTLVKDVKRRNISFEQFIKIIEGRKFPFPKDHQMSFHTYNALTALQFEGVDYYETIGEFKQVR